MPVHEEPRHRLVHEGDGFRVLDVRVAPGDTSFYHTHEAPIAYVSIVPSTMDSQPLGGAWSGNGPDDPPPFAAGEVAWNLSYADTGPVDHRIANVGSGAFHLVAIIHGGAGDPEPLPADSPADAVEEENPWFRVARVILRPGRGLAWGDTGRPAVAVLIEGEGARILRPGGPPATIEGAGAFFVRPPGTGHQIRALGDRPVEVVLIDIK